MLQIARNITDFSEPLLPEAKFLIMDGDKKFTHQFKEYLKEFGIKPKVITPRSPDLNAFAERFVLSIKEECLRQMILWSWGSLKYAVSEYIKFYNYKRPHQGIKNITPIKNHKKGDGEIVKDSTFGGLLNYYYREAA